MKPVVLDVNGFFDHIVGDHGLSIGDVDELRPRVVEILKGLARRREAGELPFYRLPYDERMIARVEEYGERLRRRFSTLVVLGIGGSALGAKAVIDAMAPGGDGVRVEVVDNIDPATFRSLLDGLDLSDTTFNVISKSGETAETMAQFMIVRERLRAKLGDRGYRERVLATTDPTGGTLRRIATVDGLSTLDVPHGVGGRFSALSAVGLLPIAAAGLDIRELCAGARAMDVRTSLLDLWANPAALHAALLWLALSRRGARIHVLMPYRDGLLRLAEWYGQLWAESLGKRRSLDGTIVETGQTPVRALGATDQHSQVQLYVEGPRDKVVTFVRVEEHGEDLEIPRVFPEEPALAYLGGHRLGELLNIEQQATELALWEAGRLTSVLALASLDEGTIGQLFHLFEVQTLVAAGLLNVDPLDQPGVELGKRYAQALAGRTDTGRTARAAQRRLASKRADLVLR